MNSITQFKVAMTIWTLAKVAFVTFWATLNPFYVIPAYFLVEIATSLIVGPEIKKIRVQKTREDRPKTVNDPPALEKSNQEKVSSTPQPEQVVTPIEKTSVESAPLQDTSNRKRVAQKKTTGTKKSSGKKPYKPRASKSN